MNILKHMEAVFVVTVAVLGSAAVVTETLPEANARSYSAPAVGVANAEAPVAVVYVTGKRMSAEEKRLSLEEEQQSTGSRG